MKKKCQETQLVNEYYGITQDPNTKDFMIITKYYALGDLKHYLSNEFYNIYWEIKLRELYHIIGGLRYIHDSKIIHRDFHSGNILVEKQGLFFQ